MGANGRVGGNTQTWWDDICTRCEACCYRRDRVAGELAVNKQAPCRFLDTDSNLCTVYTSRFEKCAECRQVTLFHALFSRYLPEDNELTDTDFSPALRQKGVDMRIGLDIASITLKRQANVILLVAGDADFVPGAKLARREGVHFILDPLWQNVPEDPHRPR